jgi:hypothetical protein
VRRRPRNSSLGSGARSWGSTRKESFASMSLFVIKSPRQPYLANAKGKASAVFI